MPAFMAFVATVFVVALYLAALLIPAWLLQLVLIEFGCPLAFWVCYAIVWLAAWFGGLLKGSK